MARVPTIDEEDAKRPNRERDGLVGERTRIVNRIKSTLARLGIRKLQTNPAQRGRASGNRAHPGGDAGAAKHLGRAAA
jgi:transposase